VVLAPREHEQRRPIGLDQRRPEALRVISAGAGDGELLEAVATPQQRFPSLSGGSSPNARSPPVVSGGPWLMLDRLTSYFQSFSPVAQATVLGVLSSFLVFQAVRRHEYQPIIAFLLALAAIGLSLVALVKVY
jgi:hypothetical protein